MMKRRSVVIIILVGIILVAGGLYAGLNEDKSGNTLSDELFGWSYPVAKFPLVGQDPDQLTYSDIRDPGGIPQGLPVRLKIPVIGVDSAVEDAFITPDGRMDVPFGSKNVAWFSLGPRPGRIGSAVIGGHFGIQNGVKFVFYDLDKLRVGDRVYVVDDKGDTLTFVVRRVELFDRDADAARVFTSDDGLAHLNLITCEGAWNRVNDTYPNRRVVFTDAIAPEGAVLVPQITPAALRLLTFGAQGFDVVALQNALEQKGFLVMPPGSSKGFFGTLTKAAVMKYQKSVGLPPVGVFGPLTSASLSAELLGFEPSLPRTAIPVPESKDVATTKATDSTPQFVKSLYATPLDASITLILLALIGFMIFKIIKR